MSQVTLYLDDEAEKILNRFSKKNRLSKSKWLSSLIQKETISEWPEKLLKLAGKWADFPSLKEIRSGQGKTFLVRNFNHVRSGYKRCYSFF